MPLINKKAIEAENKRAMARQLEALYNYQRVILTAFTEVVNRMSKVGELRQEPRDQGSSWSGSRPPSTPPPSSFRMPGPNTWKCSWPSVTSNGWRMVLIETKGATRRPS